MPKKSIVPPIAGNKCCKTHFHNFTQVAMNQVPAIGRWQSHRLQEDCEKTLQLLSFVCPTLISSNSGIDGNLLTFNCVPSPHQAKKFLEKPVCLFRRGISHVVYNCNISLMSSMCLEMSSSEPFPWALQGDALCRVSLWQERWEGSMLCI